VDQNDIDEILDVLLSHLEAAEVRSTALLQLLKHNGTVTDEQLAPYLEQASNASEIKSHAVRLRLKRILSSLMPDPDEEKKHDEAAAQKAASDQKVEAEHDKESRKSAPREEAGEAEEQPADPRPQNKEQAEPVSSAPKKGAKSQSEIPAEKKAK
jgi:hypothetical protein